MVVGVNSNTSMGDGGNQKILRKWPVIVNLLGFRVTTKTNPLPWLCYSF